MNIVITLAGHSRRFKALGYSKPKFLIEIDGRSIISHVVDMFDEEDEFHFVLNSEQVKQYPEIINILNSLAKKAKIHVIKPHEKGPVFSVLQINSIKDEEEIIISYCDFIVDWNYKKFLKEVRGYDGAVPSFKGFHPASFGHTYYAYMRVNEKNEMLELREKNSFTDARHDEPASTGIYYFKNWQIFKKYANKIMIDGFENLKEGYVSLLFNPMAHDGLKILVNYVSKFICLGTPEDLEQYLFWSKYFNHKQDVSFIKKSSKQTNLIPMAGKGSRFRQYGYRISKPLIQIQNTSMVVKACNSFPSSDNWVFVVRAEDLKKFPIEKTLNNNFANPKVVSVDYDTSGQLATCLLARDKIDKDNSLFIASADYETIFSLDKWQNILNDKTIDVAIWTCRVGSNLTKNPKAFAYCEANPKTNIVNKIVEKNTISNDPGNDPLVVGSFWFRKASDFFIMADKVIEKNITINGEHYVGNGINLMIKEGKKVTIFDINQWVSYGDPFELDIFFYWEEFFKQRK
jgi:NDP-sugar pyrophosphorylase family protein